MLNVRLYLIEAALLGLFMLSACAWVVVMQHPGSPVATRVRSPLLRRAVIGLAMGATAVALITSPWGRLSGAHMNPAVTLAFAMLGKVGAVDAAGYIAAQCVGGVVGVWAARRVLGPAVGHETVNFVMTVPASGTRGRSRAFAAEVGISFVLLTTVLLSANTSATMAYTPFAAGTLVFLYITFEAPISGMSMNPARTLGSAVMARRFEHLPLYFTAPTLGMAAAAMLYSGVFGQQAVHCAKLDHRGELPCPFECTIEAVRDPDGRGGIEGGLRARAGAR